MKIKKIDLRGVEGFRLGNAENLDKGTGCTVIICEDGATGGVDVRGGAPATRETDLLRSENTVESVNAVVLSGGSAFGLEAASGVMKELSERGVGFKAGDITVPIVTGASLFDLAVGDSSVYPDIEMGREACNNAFEGKFECGNRGAGTGASVGKSDGMQKAMKTGLGTFACADDFVQVGAVAAVNAVGDVYNGAGNIIAGLRTDDGESIFGTIKTLKSRVHNEEEDIFEPGDDVDDPDTRQIREKHARNKAEIADAIKSAFNSKINEVIRTEPGDASEVDMSEVDALVDMYTDEDLLSNQGGMMSDQKFVTAELSREDIDNYANSDDYDSNARTVNEAVEDESSYTEGKRFKDDDAASTDEDNILNDSAVSDNSDSQDYSEYEEYEITTENEGNSDYDLGYDIPFNTTLSCVITNAKLSKAQANKLASILHDAYARAIKPVHSTMDGDTIFVLASGRQEVNFDAFAALATDVLQYAIIDAAMSAKSAYGLPAACDIIR